MSRTRTFTTEPLAWPRAVAKLLAIPGSPWWDDPDTTYAGVAAYRAVTENA